MPRRLRILIVEDYPDTASSLQHLIEMWGHEADIASNGHDGLRLAQEGDYDAVILDIALPNGPDGIAVGREIAKKPRRPFLIVYSGSCAGPDWKPSKESSFDLHLEKGSIQSVALLQAMLASISPA